MVIESETHPVPVTGRDRARYVESTVERNPEERRVAEQVADLMPDTIPVISSLNIDDVGRLWVGRTMPQDALPQYDVFERDGSYVRTVELAFQAARYIPIRIRRNRIYTVVRDSMDVPYVVRSVPLLDDASAAATRMEDRR